MQQDSFFDVHLLVFGTHLSQAHGLTIGEIEKDEFQISLQLNTSPSGDSPEAIVKSMAKTMEMFSDFWKASNYDLVFCLGDRYEMFAACASSVPFGIKLAHLHGGESTLAAIDNVFRHSISHMSLLHFACTEVYKNRLLEMLGNTALVSNCGALSYDNLEQLNLLSVVEFNELYQFDFSKPSLLVTFHPETIGFEKNTSYMNEFTSALKELTNFQFLISMPNADTTSNNIRKTWMRFIDEVPDRAKAVENLGTIGYLSAMKHCYCLLGNSSSGFAEAAYFPKWVINIGNRQKGRLETANIISCPIEKTSIINAINKIGTMQSALEPISVYGNGEAANNIVSIVKKWYAEKTFN